MFYGVKKRERIAYLVAGGGLAIGLMGMIAVVTLLPWARDSVAARGHPTVRVAPVALNGVAVVALLACRRYAVPTRGEGAVAVAAVTVDEIPVVTGLARIQHSVAANSEGRSLRRKGKK